MTAPNINLPVSGEWASSFDLPVQHVAEPPKPAEPPAPKPMSVVLPFIERERAQVLRLLAFSRQLNSGKPLSRTLYLVPFKGLKIDDVMEAARAAFETVEVIRDHEGAVSDWKKGDKVRDAAGPNSLFRQAAWHFLLSKPPAGPWLWLEPDCVPLVANWHEAIEAAYRASGKPFLGARMTFAEVGDHLNGVAVYPRDAVNRAPALVTRSTWTNFPDLEIAFDVAGGADVLRQATVTDLIAFEPVDVAVLVHGDRDGKILESLSGGASKLPSKEGCSRRDKAGVAAQKSPKRKRGDAKCKAPLTSAGSCTELQQRKKKPLGSNGAKKFNPEFAPVFGVIESLPPLTSTIGDRIRFHVAELVRLGSNSNRRTRILKLLRKTTLLPRIAR